MCRQVGDKKNRITSVREIVKRRDIYSQTERRQIALARSGPARGSARDRRFGHVAPVAPVAPVICVCNQRVAPMPISFVRKQRECEKAECRAAEQVPRFPGADRQRRRRRRWAQGSAASSYVNRAHAPPPPPLLPRMRANRIERTCRN